MATRKPTNRTTRAAKLTASKPVEATVETAVAAAKEPVEAELPPAFVTRVSLRRGKSRVKPLPAACCGGAR